MLPVALPLTVLNTTRLLPNETIAPPVSGPRPFGLPVTRLSEMLTVAESPLALTPAAPALVRPLLLMWQLSTFTLTTAAVLCACTPLLRWLPMKLSRIDIWLVRSSALTPNPLEYRRTLCSEATALPAAPGTVCTAEPATLLMWLSAITRRLLPEGWNFTPSAVKSLMR